MWMIYHLSPPIGPGLICVGKAFGSLSAGGLYDVQKGFGQKKGLGLEGLGKGMGVRLGRDLGKIRVPCSPL